MVKGRLAAEGYSLAIGPLQDFMEKHRSIKLIKLIEVSESFGGFDLSTMWDGIKFDMRNIRHISHGAVVSHVGWIGPLAKAVRPLISTKPRPFGVQESPEARVSVKSAETRA